MAARELPARDLMRLTGAEVELGTDANAVANVEVACEAVVVV